jgi:hypothetical protein
MPLPTRAAAILLIAAAAATAAPAAARTPLFAAFRTLCIATGARPRAVAAAVTRADPAAASQGVVERQAAYMSLTWRPLVRHARFRVSVTSLRDTGEHPHWPPWTMAACTVIGEADAGASLPSFRAELGLTDPDANPHPNPLHVQAFFRQAGRHRTPISRHDLPATLAALEAGRLWDATADADGQATYLSLEHYRPVEGAGAAARQQASGRAALPSRFPF